MKRLMVSIACLHLARSAAADELLIARPRASFVAAVSGHGMVGSIVERPHWGGGLVTTLGAQRVVGVDAATFTGGSVAVMFSQTPMGRAITAMSAEGAYGARFGGLHVRLGVLIGALMIARSTGDSPQSSLILGLVLTVAHDLVRWDSGGLFVEARGVGAYGLPMASVGLGVRF